MFAKFNWCNIFILKILKRTCLALYLFSNFLPMCRRQNLDLLVLLASCLVLVSRRFARNLFKLVSFSGFSEGFGFSTVFLLRLGQSYFALPFSCTLHVRSLLVIICSSRCLLFYCFQQKHITLKRLTSPIRLKQCCRLFPTNENHSSNFCPY